jgi:hypothetical protein
MLCGAPLRVLLWTVLLELPAEGYRERIRTLADRSAHQKRRRSIRTAEENE